MGYTLVVVHLFLLSSFEKNSRSENVFPTVCVLRFSSRGNFIYITMQLDFPLDVISSPSG